MTPETLNTLDLVFQAGMTLAKILIFGIPALFVTGEILAKIK